jgi:hypothetical protein
MSILSADELIEAALKLPASDRLRISLELSDSVPVEGMLSEDDAGFFEELDRRREALRSGSDPGSDAFEAIRQIEDELDRQGGR